MFTFKIFQNDVDNVKSCIYNKTQAIDIAKIKLNKDPYLEKPRDWPSEASATTICTVLNPAD
jgi:hypothetical protein